MLIDFCHHSVGSSIKSDKVAFDGYEVDNLVSCDTEKKCKGFLSDHFVKPPINVTVQFPCNVAIHRIIIDPVIGQQKSCDIKIFTACEKIVHSWLYNKACSGTMKSDSVVFNFMGNVSQTDPKTVCFINQHFKERGNWGVQASTEMETFPCTAFLNSRKPGGLIYASHVTISVTKTKDSKSAALRRLEIWGIPSVQVPQQVQNILRKAYIEGIKCKVPQKLPELNQVSTVEVKNDDKMEKLAINEIPIPEDFIDPLTCEIMTVPVLLPSGKMVDEQSLNRYVNIEASWGRPPNDPFTGVAFSAGSKPVTDSSLKSRIDQFVLKHSYVLKVPQTLGHSKTNFSHNYSAAVSSRLVKNESTVSSKLTSQEVVIIDDSDDNDSDFHRKMSENNKRTRIKDEVTSFGLESDSKRQRMDINNSHQSSAQESSQPKTEDTRIDHMSALTKSLDAALLSALGNLPSFNRVKSQKLESTQETSPVCCLCNMSLVHSETAKYRMPCSHFVCRACLIKDNSLICNACKRHFKSSEALRVF